MTTRSLSFWAALTFKAWRCRDWPLLLWLRRQLEPWDQREVDREVRRLAALARHEQN